MDFVCLGGGGLTPCPNSMFFLNVNSICEYMHFLEDFNYKRYLNNDIEGTGKLSFKPTYIVSLNIIIMVSMGV